MCSLTPDSQPIRENKTRGALFHLEVPPTSEKKRQNIFLTSQEKPGNIELKVGRLYFKIFQIFYHWLVCGYKSQI